jgi:hypothetical protein
MEERYKIASIDARKFAPSDLIIYRSHREILTRVASLQKLWKDAKTEEHRKEVKKLTIQLLNKNFDGIETTCGFLGVISTPYVLTRLRRQMEDILSFILEKYNIPFPTRKNKIIFEEKDCFNFYLPDDLDIWIAVNK